jgi:hypothetical protein
LVATLDEHATAFNFLIRTPVQAPNANAVAERWVGTVAGSASTTY